MLNLSSYLYLSILSTGDVPELPSIYLSIYIYLSICLQVMFLNLLFNSVRKDSSVPRVRAFIKRLLQESGFNYLTTYISIYNLSISLSLSIYLLSYLSVFLQQLFQESYFLYLYPIIYISFYLSIYKDCSSSD